MAFIAIDELETSEFIDEPVTPKRIGFCSNIKKHGEYCGNRIFDDCIEYVEIKPKVLICGPCVNALLTLSTKNFGLTDPQRSQNGTKLRQAGVVTTRDLVNHQKAPMSRSVSDTHLRK